MENNAILRNKEAFNILFLQYENRLFLFAQKITHSEFVSRDIVQEVFLKLWERIETLEEIENIEAYLYQSVKNKSIDFLRSLANSDKRRKEYFENYIFEENTVEKEISKKELNTLLAEALKKLPKQRSLIYQLSQLDGYSRKEIATAMTISESTVKNQITSARASILKFFKENLKIF